jgi:hypothetical protein
MKALMLVKLKGQMMEENKIDSLGAVFKILSSTKLTPEAKKALLAVKLKNGATFAETFELISSTPLPPDAMKALMLVRLEGV